MDILRNERSGQGAPSGGPNSSSRWDERPYTTLGKDTEFEGTLKFKDGLRIEGKFNGDISTDGYLIIGDTGQVTAEISVGSIIVEGKITGNIQAKDLVELRSSAEMRGDITAAKLKIEEGVVFIGKSDVQPRDGSKNQQSRPPQKQEDDKKDKVQAQGGNK